ncbi:hypothetical protein J4E91_002432 [Alternaria rosae]|nr:hypothetical protein J4E91_002432 [Alternaria rosae]
MDMATGMDRAEEMRFFQPWGAFSDQATLEGYGVRKRYPKCMRCGAVKLKDHPDFKDCMGRCDCCGSSMAHIGEMCSQTWASMKWHMEHNGWLPDDVQFRPTPEQCAEFAKVDPYFGRIVPLQEIIQAPAGQGTKRKADDRDDEVEKAAAARRDEVRVQQLKRLQAAADGLTRALNAQKIATQQAEALAWERGRTNDQQSEELENLRLVVTKKEAATKRPLKTNRELVEEIRSVKDAESRREESNRLAMEKNAARIGRFDLMDWDDGSVSRTTDDSSNEDSKEAPKKGPDHGQEHL